MPNSRVFRVEDVVQTHTLFHMKWEVMMQEMVDMFENIQADVFSQLDAGCDAELIQQVKTNAETDVKALIDISVSMQNMMPLIDNIRSKLEYTTDLQLNTSSLALVRLTIYIEFLEFLSSVRVKTNNEFDFVQGKLAKAMLENESLEKKQDFQRRISALQIISDLLPAVEQQLLVAYVKSIFYLDSLAVHKVLEKRTVFLVNREKKLTSKLCKYGLGNSSNNLQRKIKALHLELVIISQQLIVHKKVFEALIVRSVELKKLYVLERSFSDIARQHKNSENEEELFTKTITVLDAEQGKLEEQGEAIINQIHTINFEIENQKSLISECRDDIKSLSVQLTQIEKYEKETQEAIKDAEEHRRELMRKHDRAVDEQNEYIKLYNRTLTEMHKMGGEQWIFSSPIEAVVFDLQPRYVRLMQTKDECDGMIDSYYQHLSQLQNQVQAQSQYIDQLEQALEQYNKDKDNIASEYRRLDYQLRKALDYEYIFTGNLQSAKSNLELKQRELAHNYNLQILQHHLQIVEQGVVDNLILSHSNQQPADISKEQHLEDLVSVGAEILQQSLVDIGESFAALHANLDSVICPVNLASLEQLQIYATYTYYEFSISNKQEYLGVATERGKLKDTYDALLQELQNIQTDILNTTSSIYYADYMIEYLTKGPRYYRLKVGRNSLGNAQRALTNNDSLENQVELARVENELSQLNAEYERDIAQYKLTKEESTLKLQDSEDKKKILLQTRILHLSGDKIKSLLESVLKHSWGLEDGIKVSHAVNATFEEAHQKFEEALNNVKKIHTPENWQKLLSATVEADAAHHPYVVEKFIHERYTTREDLKTGFLFGCYDCLTSVQIPGLQDYIVKPSIQSELVLLMEESSREFNERIERVKSIKVKIRELLGQINKSLESQTITCLQQELSVLLQTLSEVRVQQAVAQSIFLESHAEAYTQLNGESDTNLDFNNGLIHQQSVLDYVLSEISSYTKISDEFPQDSELANEVLEEETRQFISIFHQYLADDQIERIEDDLLQEFTKDDEVIPNPHLSNRRAGLILASINDFKSTKHDADELQENLIVRCRMENTELGRLLHKCAEELDQEDLQVADELNAMANNAETINFSQPQVERVQTLHRKLDTNNSIRSKIVLLIQKNSSISLVNSVNTKKPAATNAQLVTSKVQACITRQSVLFLNQNVRYQGNSRLVNSSLKLLPVEIRQTYSTQVSRTFNHGAFASYAPTSSSTKFSGIGFRVNGRFVDQHPFADYAAQAARKSGGKRPPDETPYRRIGNKPVQPLTDEDKKKITEFCPINEAEVPLLDCEREAIQSWREEGGVLKHLEDLRISNTNLAALLSHDLIRKANLTRFLSGFEKDVNVVQNNMKVDDLTGIAKEMRGKRFAKSEGGIFDHFGNEWEQAKASFKNTIEACDDCLLVLEDLKRKTKQNGESDVQTLKIIKATIDHIEARKALNRRIEKSYSSIIKTITERHISAKIYAPIAKPTPKQSNSQSRVQHPHLVDQGGENGTDIYKTHMHTTLPKQSIATTTPRLVPHLNSIKRSVQVKARPNYIVQPAPVRSAPKIFNLKPAVNRTGASAAVPHASHHIAVHSFTPQFKSFKANIKPFNTNTATRSVPSSFRPSISLPGLRAQSNIQTRLIQRVGARSASQAPLKAVSARSASQPTLRPIAIPAPRIALRAPATRPLLQVRPVLRPTQSSAPRSAVRAAPRPAAVQRVVPRPPPIRAAATRTVPRAPSRAAVSARTQQRPPRPPRPPGTSG